jgi:hypothetical protein
MREEALDAVMRQHEFDNCLDLRHTLNAQSEVK